MTLRSDFGERTINELSLMFRDRQINLEPGFQRKSVWTPRDRRRLIESILSGFPVPCIFLYQRHDRGKPVYDVIDGKQRLETIFMFTRQGRFKRMGFEVKLDFGDGRDWYEWSDLRGVPDKRHALESYKIQTVEVSGELAEIIRLFVAINSTGKRLTSGEKRHARFYNNPFLKQAGRLVARYQSQFLKNRMLSQAQLDRMKGVELVAELLMSVHAGGVINKKAALDRALENDSVNGHTLDRNVREFVRCWGHVRRMFPDLRETRFRNVADFYSLFMLVWQMEKDNFILHDLKRNRVASRLLTRLSDGVDELRLSLRKVVPVKKSQQLFSDYLLTVQGDTDSAANRQRRGELLKGLLFSLFDYKDDRRSFSSEQRRLLWNSDEKRACGSCRRQLSWSDFTIDHVLAWARGGKATLANAQLMCRPCNSRKGAR